MKYIIIMGPAKVIAKSTDSTWKDLNCNLILITSNSPRNYTKVITLQFKKYFFKKIFIENYNDSDQVTYVLSELVKQYAIERIIPLSEIDILRAAIFNKYVKKPWLDWEQAVYFRDKFKMKSILRSQGISLPKFSEVTHLLDADKFIQENGYPVILKPKDGRGSNKVEVILNKEDLIKLSKQDYFKSDSCFTGLIIEEYLNDWEQYRVDGVYIDFKPAITVAAKYIGNHLNYLKGGWLASHLLSNRNPLKNILEDFSTHVLYYLPIPSCFSFHFEVFVKEDQLKFSEVGIRLGGGSIVNEIALSKGINIRDIYIKAMLDQKIIFNNENQENSISGQLHIAPKSRRLIYIPSTCNIKGVAQYRPNYLSGSLTPRMKYTNAEAASFVFEAEDEVAAGNKIHQLRKWFHHNTIWEDS